MCLGLFISSSPSFEVSFSNPKSKPCKIVLSHEKKMMYNLFGHLLDSLPFKVALCSHMSSIDTVLNFFVKGIDQSNPYSKCDHQKN